MRRAALMVMICGCNQVFGMQRTVSTDATYFDAPTDAPFACPAVDATPSFSPYVHLVAVDHCGMWIPSYPTGRAVATCHDELGRYGLYEGPLGGDLSLAIPVDFNGNLDLPRLSSDGQTLYARRIDYSTNAIWIVAYTRTGAGWTAAPDPALPQLNDIWLGTIGRAPDGDRVLVSIPSGLSLDEWSSAGGTWHQIASHSASELGVPSFSDHALSSDGLRIVFHSQLATGLTAFYSARASVDAPFRAASELPNLPLHAGDLVITDDCARITFSGLDSLFYVQQL